MDRITFTVGRMSHNSIVGEGTFTIIYSQCMVDFQPISADFQPNLVPSCVQTAPLNPVREGFAGKRIHLLITHQHCSGKGNRPGVLVLGGPLLGGPLL